MEPWAAAGGGGEQAGVAADGGAAVAVEPGQEGALGGGDGAGLGVFDAGEQAVQGGVGGADGDADDSLSGGGHHGVGVERQHRCVVEMEAFDTRQSQQAGRAVAAADLFDAGLDVAADEGDTQVGAGVEQLRLAAEGVGADGGAVGQRGERGRRGSGVVQAGPRMRAVAGVLAAEGAGEDDAGGELGLEVLEAVDGEVDAAVEQGLVDFLAEEAFAADLGQVAVLHDVAGGADDVLLEHRGGPGPGGRGRGRSG